MKEYVFSNGTIFELFQEKWCRNCERDKAIWSCWDETKQQYIKEPQWEYGCPILARAIRYDIKDKRFPGEIHCFRDYSECTAFVMSDTLRLAEKTVSINNQSIIEFAYLTKDIIEICYGQKLYFEEANCYLNCFYKMRSFLKLVDAEYLAQHKKITEFFREGRELSNDWDRLYFESEQEPEAGR